MEIIKDTIDFSIDGQTAVAIGKFDGIHVGHRQLIREILSCKEKGLKTCVFTFDPAPAVLFGLSDGRELTTREEKRFLFEQMGIDVLIEFPLTFENAAMEPEYFVRKVLAEQMHVKMLVAGTDLSFGAKGAGNVDLLMALAPELGFAVKTIEKVCMDGEEVSSTCVRRYVEGGNLFSAARMLGMPYMISGTVVHGKHLGSTIGFPTVNVLPGEGKLLPPNGVYFSEVKCCGEIYRAISNVGYKPTVTKERVCGLESYLYDFDKDIYGEFVEIYLYEFRRPERKFESLDALKEQLTEDIAAGKQYIFENNHE